MNDRMGVETYVFIGTAGHEELRVAVPSRRTPATLTDASAGRSRAAQHRRRAFDARRQAILLRRRVAHDCNIHFVNFVN